MQEIKINSLRDKQKENMRPAAGTPAPEPSPARPARPKRAPRLLLRFGIFTAFVFLVGGFGGVWLDRILLPTLLVKYPELSRFEYLKRVNERTTIVHETEEITVSQEKNISDTIEKVSPAMVRVRNRQTDGQFKEVGSGIILTSDGYLITPLQNLYAGKEESPAIEVQLKSGKVYAATVRARDTNYGQAILKIEENNLPVIPYAGAKDLKLGQKLVIINDAVATDIISKLLDQYQMPGSTASAPQKRIQIGQSLGTAFAGSAVIDVEGKLVGVEQGGDIVIPLSEIKSFIDRSIVH